MTPSMIFRPKGWKSPEQILLHFNSSRSPETPSTNQASPIQVQTAARSGLSAKKSNPPSLIQEFQGVLFLVRHGQGVDGKGSSSFPFFLPW